MMQCTLSNEEILRRKVLSGRIRKMVSESVEIMEQEENWIKSKYKGFVLRIIFSDLHPLMVFCLEKPIAEIDRRTSKRTNFVNLISVLGSHCINEYDGLYQYRATHWIDTEMTKARFLEILDRCVIEASRGYRKIAS